MSTKWTQNDIPDLSGNVVVITGALGERVLYGLLNPLLSQNIGMGVRFSL